jgi:signal transduction histidine kinase
MQQLFRIRFHLIVALSILLGCLVPQAAWATALTPGDGIKAPVSLSGHMSVLRDPTGALTIDNIVSRGAKFRFEPIPSMLTEGYLKGAIWVRFSLSAPATSNQWLLQIERPLIQHVTLYVPDTTGRLVAAAPGRLHPREGDDANAYPALFPISVPSTETQYYIRFQSMTSITTALNMWQKEGYENYRRSDDWIMGAVVGAIGTMLFANLLYAAWLRDSLYLLYGVFLLESGLVTIFHMGYASEILHSFEPRQIYLIWGIVVCLYSIVMILFVARLFEFRRHSVWGWRIAQGIASLNGIALMFAIAGRYGDVGFFVSRLQQLSLIFVALFVLYLLAARRQYQYLLPAIAFLGVLSVLFAMQLLFTGANPLGLNGSLSRFLAIGTLIHLVLLSAAIAKRTRLAEQSLSEEKDRVIAMSRSAAHELTIKVRERTAELAERNVSLKAEVTRRHLLEMKLRQSLDSVNDALAQQRDFVAMVSHEFRAPLAVIAAAAENLPLAAAEGVGDITSYTARIRRTVRRMSTLIENVLAGDRLETGQALPTGIAKLDLNEILLTIKAGLDDEAARRVGLVHDGEATVTGDRYLLEIVVQNLIQNALKYSAKTTAVTVRLSTDREMVLVEVTDQGVGVAVDDREFIFMKYYRAAGQQVSGSGLGLYIARTIAGQHGGDLILATSDGNGSTFRLSLPVAEPQLGDFRSRHSVPWSAAGSSGEQRPNDWLSLTARP